MRKILLILLLTIPIVVLAYDWQDQFGEWHGGLGVGNLDGRHKTVCENPHILDGRTDFRKVARKRESFPVCALNALHSTSEQRII